MAFSHLHVHTEYSLLDGAARIGKIVETAKEMGIDAARWNCKRKCSWVSWKLF